MKNNQLNLYANPPYKRDMPQHRLHARFFVSAKRYNDLVRDYNELIDDIDMLLRAIDQSKR